MGRYLLGDRLGEGSYGKVRGESLDHDQRTRAKQGRITRWRGREPYKVDKRGRETDRGREREKERLEESKTRKSNEREREKKRSGEEGTVRPRQRKGDRRPITARKKKREDRSG